MLLHGIMASISEFYSRNLATESNKGMTQKAKSGGTPTKAPLGYVNVGVRDDVGREVRTVQADPARGPLVAWAFKAFASGNWTVAQMHRELDKRGLTTRPTPKRPAKPLSKSGIHRLLTNPYYKGTIVFRGATYKGCHEPLIPPEVFYRVQKVLEGHKSSTDRTQIHDHYLKGLVYCGQCHSRLFIVHARSHTGSIYPYFVCSGRQQRKTECLFQAIQIEDVEDLVAAYYERLAIPAGVREQLRNLVHVRFDQMTAEAKPELAALTIQRKAIEEEQDRLLDAYLKKTLDEDAHARKQREQSEQLEQVKADIAILSHDYAEARRHLEDALSLLSDPAKLYTVANADTRRLANQTFFKRIEVCERGDGDNEPSCDGLNHARTLQIQLEPPYTYFHDPETQEEARDFAAASCGIDTAKRRRSPADMNVATTRSMTDGSPGMTKTAVQPTAGSTPNTQGWLTGLEPAAAWTTTRSSTN